MKLIVMDMDGTLLTSEKKISDKTRQSLIDTQQKGNKLVLASGRVKSRLDEFAILLKMDQFEGYLIEANGSCIYRYNEQSREIIREMSKAEVKEIYTYMKTEFSSHEVIIMADVNAYIYLPEGKKGSGYFNMNNMESLKNREIFYLKDEDEIDGIKETIFKICTFDSPENINVMASKVEKDLSHIYWSGRTMPYWLEILPKEVSKGNALLKLIEEIGIDKKDVYAFGDGENDISMLKVGHGIAMANAIDTVKEECDEHTLSNDEDGISVYLKTLE